MDGIYLTLFIIMRKISKRLIGQGCSGVLLLVILFLIGVDVSNFLVLFYLRNQSFCLYMYMAKPLK